MHGFHVIRDAWEVFPRVSTILVEREETFVCRKTHEACWLFFGQLDSTAGSLTFLGRLLLVSSATLKDRLPGFIIVRVESTRISDGSRQSKVSWSYISAEQDPPHY